jgi:O-antigen/teichoic acid export membrane protein
MATKILIVIGLLIILYSLASALYYLVRDHGESDRTVQRLTWRIALSLVLFLAMWGAYQMGWIQPRSGPVNWPEPEQPAASE